MSHTSTNAVEVQNLTSRYGSDLLVTLVVSTQLFKWEPRR